MAENQTQNEMNAVLASSENSDRDKAKNCLKTAQEFLKEFRTNAKPHLALLNQAVDDFERAVLLYSPGAERNRTITRLANTLLFRAAIFPKLEDMQRGVGFRAGAELGFPIDHFFIVAPEHTGKSAEQLVNEATEGLDIFIGLQDQMVLQNCVPVLHEALELLPESDALKWKILWELASALLIISHLNQDDNPLVEAIVCLRQVAHMKPNRQICLSAALATGFLQLIDQQTLQEAIDIHRSCSQKDIQALPLAQSGQALFRQAANLQILNNAIECLGTAESLLSLGHRHRKSVLHQLGGSLAKKYDALRNLDHLQLAIEYLRESEELHAPTDPNRGATISNLGAALQKHFMLSGDIQDLTEAIDLIQEALTCHPPSHPYHTNTLNSLANALQLRFQAQNDLGDINDAIQLFRQSLQINSPSSAEWSTYLNNLATALELKFQVQDSTGDIQEAIRYFREALALRPAPHPQRFYTLVNLSGALLLEYGSNGELEILAEAIGHGQEALTCLPRQSDWVSAALNLGTALLLQFDKVGGTLEDIDECISLLEEALKGNSADSPGKALTLKYLGRSYQLRFQNSGVVSDLHTAIQHLQESKAQCSSSNPRYSSHLTPLANVLRTRFNLYGESEDLEEAIQLCKRAVKIVPIKEEDRLSALLTLGHCLTTRFTHQGTIADLEESIQLTENALASMPTSYANRRQFLSSLARALEIRFRAQYGLPGDLHKAVDLHREALLMCAQFEVNYAGLISNLASGLHARFEIEGRPEDVTEAIELYQQSIELQSQASDSDKRLIPSYNNLAGALQARFSQTHNSSDIHKAVELLEKVVTMSLGTLDHGGHLANHGRVLYKVYMQSSNREYLEKAISAMKTASTDPLSPPLSRFDASNGWSSMAWRTKHGSALEAYRNSIQLLPQIAAIHLDLKERQKITSRDDVVALASDGAAYALDLHEYNTAVEFLEASRSVFWNQALNLRVGLGDLSLTKPELAQRFEKLAGQIEQVSFHSSHNNQLEQADDVIERSVVHRLSKEWDEVVHTIRSVSGFEGFLKTKQIAVLKKAAVLGPVVILNVNELSTVALIIQESHDILHVPLPDVIVDVMQSAPGQPERAGQIYSAVGDSDQRGARKEHQQQISPDLILYHQLADLWNQVAKPVLAALGIKKTENPTRLWWCPTGPFVFLPFHAAGIYEGNDQDCVSNYVISSYTPTLSALLDKPKYPVKALKMTAVIEPRAKNMRNLPGTTQERKEIASYVPSGSLTILDSPTKAEVLKHLAQSNIVHFACHGRQDTKNPLDSGLMLRDGRLTVSEIMQSRDAHRTQNGPSLAVLSACDTGKGDAKTPDEAMHIAATLLFAGFSSVVATMWPIHDDDGPTLTAAFYNHLFNKATTSSAEVPNLLGTAEALHIAVKKLRENPEVTFTRWVPFVHYGW